MSTSVEMTDVKTCHCIDCHCYLLAAFYILSASLATSRHTQVCDLSRQVHDVPNSMCAKHTNICNVSNRLYPGVGHVKSAMLPRPHLCGISVYKMLPSEEWSFPLSRPVALAMQSWLHCRYSIYRLLNTTHLPFLMPSQPSSPTTFIESSLP